MECLLVCIIAAYWPRVPPKIGYAPEVLIGLRNGREIVLRLVGIAPSNTQWKKDLAWFDDQIARLKGQTQSRDAVFSPATTP